jgi:hypothetical protein
LYVPRKQGKRGLMQLEEAYTVNITKLVEYVDRKKDHLIQIARTHQHNINSGHRQLAAQDSSTERNKTNEGQQSKENKRKMARDAWIIAM